MPAVDLTPYYQPQGSTSDGSKYDNGLALIQSTLNGIDNNNFASGKIFDPSKLMQNSAVDGDGLAYDSAAGIWKRTTDKPLRIAALAGYPGSGSVFLAGDGTWKTAGGSTTYRKTTAKAVNTTVAATDLLNAEITVAANALGANSVLRFKAWGDWLQNSGGSSNPPLLQVKLGATTLFQTPLPTVVGVGNSATRRAWWIEMSLNAAGATNAQAAECSFQIGIPVTPTSGSGWEAAWTTGEGDMLALSTATHSGIYFGSAFNTSAVDMTGAQALVLNVTNASSSVSYETKLYGALAEIV